MMAQVGVQQPTNLMEMFSSPSLMMGDIASQQVNDQTLGNLLNRQQAQQAMDFASQEQPFKLDQLGLANDTTRAQLPGHHAASSLSEDKAKISKDTMSDQITAARSKLAKEVSESDLAQAENAVKTALVHPSAAVRDAAQQMWQHLYEIKKERDKLAIQSGNAMALAKEHGVQQRETDTNAAGLGKWAKSSKALSLVQSLNAAKKPIEIDAILRQILADPELPPEERAAYQTRHEANRAALDTENQLRAIQTQGKPNAAQLANLPAVTTPQATPGPGAETEAAKPTTLASPKTQAEYDKLPSGSIYIDTDGKTKRKK